MTQARLLSATIAMVAVAFTALGTMPLAGLSSTTQPNQPDLPGDPGGGATCNYCTQEMCGCAAGTAQHPLSYSCGCSSIDCWQTCTYG